MAPELGSAPAHPGGTRAEGRGRGQEGSLEFSSTEKTAKRQAPPSSVWRAVRGAGGAARRDAAATSTPNEHAQRTLGCSPGARPGGPRGIVPRGCEFVCSGVAPGLRTITGSPESQRGWPPQPRRLGGGQGLTLFSQEPAASSEGHATLALRAVDQASQVRAPGPFLQSAPVTNSPVLVLCHASAVHCRWPPL